MKDIRQSRDESQSIAAVLPGRLRLSDCLAGFWLAAAFLFVVLMVGGLL